MSIYECEPRDQSVLQKSLPSNSDAHIKLEEGEYIYIEQAYAHTYTHTHPFMIMHADTHTQIHLKLHTVPLTTTPIARFTPAIKMTSSTSYSDIQCNPFSEGKTGVKRKATMKMALVHPWQKDQSPGASSELYSIYRREEKVPGGHLNLLLHGKNPNDNAKGGVYKQLEELRRGGREGERARECE